MNRLLGMLSVALLAGAVLAAPLWAAQWNVADGDFSLASSWLYDTPPEILADSYIANGGAAWLNSTSATPSYTISPVHLLVGCYALGVVDGTGTLTLGTGGTLTLTGSEGIGVGYQQTGTLNVSGGTCTGGNQLSVGASDDGSKTGYGYYNQSGGTFSCANVVAVGSNGGVGVATVTTGTLKTTASDTTSSYGIFVGYDSGAASLGGTGIMRQSGGTVTGTNMVSIGGNGNVGTYGYYQLSGGTLYQTAGASSTNNFYVGRHGYGVLEQTGGTVDTRSRLQIGGDPYTSCTGAYGVYNLSGGTAYAVVAGSSSTLSIGAGGGIGVLNISGGLYQTRGAASAGTRIMVGSGSAINLGAVGTGGGTLQPNGLLGAGNLNFHGGTLKAKSTYASFVTIGRSYVYQEGAVINTDGKDVTIATVLAAPGGKGVTGITLENTGSGYTAPPVVVLSDSGTTPGTGATAIAKLNGSGGIDIVMTNPGTGYTDPSTVAVALHGGDGTGAGTVTLGNTVTLADNISGGLTKQGAGILTLSAANTYTGATVIEAGTLALASTGSITSSSSIEVKASSFFDVSANVFTLGGTQTLKGSGTVTGSVAAAAGSSIEPGASPGSLIVAGDLDLAATANVTWQLATLTDSTSGTAGTDFDQIVLKSGDLDLGAAAQLTLDFNLLAAADQPTAGPLNTFWISSHTWKVIDLDADNGGTNTGATDFTTIAVSGTMPTQLVFDTLVGTTSGVDMGDIYLTCAPTTVTKIPGDTNGDGKVNETDAQTVAANWGAASGATWAMGDFSGDGKVDAADASILAGNWGYGVTSGESAAVPEPGMLALLAGLTVLLAARRR